MKNLYIFGLFVIVILIGLAFLEPKKTANYTKLNSQNIFFDKEIFGKSSKNEIFTSKNFLDKTSILFFG